MASKNKYSPIRNKVVQDPNNKKKFKIEKANASEAGPHEVDAVDIDVASDSGYVVEKWSVKELPATMKEKGKTSDAVPVRWFTNFSVTQGESPTTNQYSVTIPRLPALINQGTLKHLVVCYGESEFVDFGAVTGNTIQLNNGDPSIGGI